MATSARLDRGSVTVEASPVPFITAAVKDLPWGFTMAFGDCQPWAGARGPRCRWSVWAGVPGGCCR